MNTLKLAAVAAAMFTQTACGTPEPAEETPSAGEGLAQTESALDPIPNLVLCTSVAADANLYVGDGYNIPFSALPYASKSGSGGYYYKGCGRYVVDIHLGATGSYGMTFSGTAHNLPSSAEIGGEMPNNAVDCAAYRQYQTFYRKNASNTWDTLGSSSEQGVWINGICQRQVYSSGTMTHLSNIRNTDGSGFDVYRVAVAVKLRSSGQEAKVVVDGDFIIY